MFATTSTGILVHEQNTQYDAQTAHKKKNTLSPTALKLTKLVQNRTACVSLHHTQAQSRVSLSILLGLLPFILRKHFCVQLRLYQSLLEGNL